MNKKKFFSLIEGPDIHLAPETKRVGAEAFSALLDSKELLNKVQEDAARYREQVVQECELSKDDAIRRGFDEGFRAWSERIAELEVEKKGLRAEFEKILVPVAMKATKKIIGTELASSEETVINIVSNSLKSVVTHRRITIYVSKDDFTALDKARPRLKRLFETLESLTIRERADLSPGSCIIETEGGIINAQIEHIWVMLEKAFNQLLKGSKT